MNITIFILQFNIYIVRIPTELKLCIHKHTRHFFFFLRNFNDALNKILPNGLCQALVHSIFKLYIGRKKIKNYYNHNK